LGKDIILELKKFFNIYATEIMHRISFLWEVSWLSKKAKSNSLSLLSLSSSINTGQEFFAAVDSGQ
jgi:hypothetical protein